mmetsp:Transcript_26115/g.29055  ORF Transcript_26115/g.29055 Transcript_26115/m.29055 type:complete len:135 (+) Transcript_26115:115-519(+)
MTSICVEDACVKVEYTVPANLDDKTTYCCKVNFTNKLPIPITDCLAYVDVDEDSPFHSEVMTCGGSGDLDKVTLDFGHIAAGGCKSKGFKFAFPKLDKDMPKQNFHGIFQLAPKFEVDYSKWGGVSKEADVTAK